MQETAVLVTAIDWIFQIASLLIVIRVFISWVFPHNDDNAFVDFIYRATEPILGPIREYIIRLMGYKVPLDISPMVAILLLLATRYFLISFIQTLLY
ncbi:YggT family protein [Candidatus Bipolaricaulota bacterium]|nr:YggT family protein [Candidatus Bipolaricaulota bacterium]